MDILAVATTRRIPTNQALAPSECPHHWFRTVALGEPGGPQWGTKRASDVHSTGRAANRECQRRDRMGFRTQPVFITICYRLARLVRALERSGLSPRMT
jgi:hypothetical protein